MATQQGDVSLLNDPVAQQLLNAPILARLAYNWNGREVVVGGPPDAPKVAALRARPDVAITIDDVQWPYQVLLLRGQAKVDLVDGVIPEYEASAHKYCGGEKRNAWVSQVGQMVSQMARIAVRPTWVAILDFETRFPSALAKRMGAARSSTAN
jgi:hypothetical protein